MAMRYKLSRNNSNLGFGGIIYYESCDNILNSDFKDVITQKDILKKCKFCSYFKKVLRFQNVNQYLTWYSIDLCYLKCM